MVRTALRPSSGVSPYRPESAWNATTTSQCPSVGRAWARERRQGHRTSQLQLSKYSPVICQAGCAMTGSYSGLTLKATRPIVGEVRPTIPGTGRKTNGGDEGVHPARPERAARRRGGHPRRAEDVRGPGQDRGLRRLPLGPLRDRRHAPPAPAHRPRPRRSRRGGSRGPRGDVGEGRRPRRPVLAPGVQPLPVLPPRPAVPLRPRPPDEPLRGDARRDGGADLHGRRGEPGLRRPQERREPARRADIFVVWPPHLYPLPPGGERAG